MSVNPQLFPIAGQSPRRARSELGRPLHVLTLTPFYPTDDNDGFGCFVSEPLDALANAGVVNTVFAMSPFYRGRMKLRRTPIQGEWMHYFSLPGSIGLPIAGAFAFARILGRIRKLLKTQPIDVIHAHAPLPCGHAAMLLSAELGIPYVVSVHGLDVFSTQHVRGKSGEWCRRICQRVYQASPRVICVSERVREEVLAGTGPKCRTSVVYNGVNPELFSPGGEPVGLKVLTVGNLIPIKGHDVLIRAIAALASEFSSLSLEIIGDGAERGRLQSLATQLQVGDRIHFLGQRSRAEVAAAMRECTLFALPSRYEGLGCVYLEAMSAGKTAIGCRGQGIAEIIQHGSNGFLVGIDNDRELALAIAMLLRDDARRRSIGAAAIDTIRERLTLVQQAERLARIYRELLA